MATSTLIRRGAAALLVAGSLALAGPGCGGDDETADTAPVRPEAATTTSEPATTEAPETTTEQTTTEQGGGIGPPEQTTTTETTTESGGGVSPDYDPAQPDTPTNDVPPNPGTPQDKFEQYCNQHPDACG